MRKPSLEWGIIYQTLFLGHALNFDLCLPSPYWLPKAQFSFATISGRLADALRVKAALCFGPTSLDFYLLLSLGLIILCYLFSSHILLRRLKKLSSVKGLPRLPLQKMEITGPQFSASSIPYSCSMAATTPCVTWRTNNQKSLFFMHVVT